MFLALRGAFASLLVDSRQYRRRLLQINPALKTPAEIDGQLGSSEGLEVLDDGPVQLQLAGIRVGLVDFYLRWWNGAHCIFSGFGKHLSHCDPRLEGDILTPQQAQERPNETAIVKLSKGCDNVRIGVLPASFFSQSAFYGPSGLPRPPGVMLTRSAKPTQRDRLRLDRYDEQDFTELVAAMRADRIWFL